MSGLCSPRPFVFIYAIMIVSCEILLSKARGYNKYIRVKALVRGPYSDFREVLKFVFYGHLLRA